MKKIILLALVFLFLCFFAAVATAADETKFALELQPWTAGGVDSSSTPITDVTAASNPGIGVRLIILEPIKAVRGLGFALGYAQGSYPIRMGNVSLGEIGATAITATARYYRDLKYLRPYVGAGGGMTSLNEATLGGDTMKIGSTSVFGPLVEMGAEIPLNFQGFYVGVNFTQHFWKKGMPMVMNVGNAPVATVTIANPQELGLVIGKKF